MTRTVLALSVICAVNALAVPIDPAPDHVGVYFDPGATTTDFDCTRDVPFTAYVIITNPTGANVSGVELGYRFVVPAGFESSFARLGHDAPTESVDFGDSGDPAQGDYYMGLAVPLPQSTAVVFATWDLVLTDDFAMDIYLGPAARSSLGNGLPAYATDGSTVALVPSSGDVDIPVATVNGGVSDVPGHELRNLVVLEQCQPNPFNPRTTIRYSTAREGRVTLSVYDMSGQTVRVLVAGEIVAPGGHEVTWDGMDGAGREVASGAYFYTIEALGVSETKRMTLVR